MTDACRSCSGVPALSGCTIEGPVETVDIMPTLAAMIGLDVALRVRWTANVSRGAPAVVCPSH